MPNFPQLAFFRACRLIFIVLQQPNMGEIEWHGKTALPLL